MTDQRNALASKFAEGARYANFGDVVMSMHIQGFRCHESTVIELEALYHSLREASRS